MKTMGHAVILAAGVGSRLRPLTDTRPKCCIEVGGVSLISRIVAQIGSVAPRFGITVVAGYLADSVRHELRAFADINIIENKFYATTNNMESCRLALENLAATEKVTIVNGDCIYDTEIVEETLRADPDVIAVDSSQYFEESMKVKIEGGLIVDIAKSLPDVPSCVTSIDLYNFSSENSKRLLGIMTDFHKRQDLKQWTEVAIKTLVSQPEIKISPLDISGLNWVEIDNADDLARANGIWR